MTEDQKNPIKKWDKKRLNFIVLPVVCVVAILLVWVYNNVSSTGEGPTGREMAYRATRDDIQNAVTSYTENHNYQSLPALNSTYTTANCLNCSVINISALLVANGGSLRIYPDGLNLSATGSDNCGGNASLGCSNDGSYIWIVDTYGNVSSYCAGTGCTTNNSGYQDIWP